MPTKARCERYVRLVRDRNISQEVRDWASRMEDVYEWPACSYFDVAYPWIAALFAVRYGVDEDLWPATLKQRDVRVALNWEAGDIPDGITVAAPERVS